MPKNILARLVLVPLLLMSGATAARQQADAAPPRMHVVQVGEASVTVPALEGYAQLKVEELVNVARQLGQANRLLALQIPRDPADPGRAKDRRLMLQIARQNEGKEVSISDFGGVKADLRKSHAAMAQPGKGDKGMPALQVGRPAGLQLFAGTDRSLAVLVGIRKPAGADGKKAEVAQVVSFANVLLRGKVMSLSVYSNLDSPADIQWVEKQTRAWIKDALAANR